MKFIAHRGLFEGPDSTIENSPEQIARALAHGYDCEIDLWLVQDKLFLGHDSPTYPVDAEYLGNPAFWIHAKNFDALRWLCANSHSNYFWHETDTYATTSHHYIWTLRHDSCTDRTVIMVVDQPHQDLLQLPCYAICSDYSHSLRKVQN